MINTHNISLVLFYNECIYNNNYTLAFISLHEIRLKNGIKNTVIIIYSL